MSYLMSESAKVLPYVAGAGVAAAGVATGNPALVAGGVGIIGASAAASQKPKAPMAPTPPNYNNAANAAQQQADALRQRRGVLANIYAGGAGGAPPAVGKSSLGT